MAATPVVVESGVDDVDRNSYTTGVIDFVAGRTYLIAFNYGRTGAAPVTGITISGATSGAWRATSAIGFNTVGTNRSRLATRRFTATSDFSEAITLDLAGTTHNGCRWICVEVPDVSPTSPLVQSTSARGDAGTTATLTFASAQQHPLNPRVAFVATDTGGSPISAGGSYSLLDQVSGTTPAESLACITYTGDEDPTATFGSADWAIVGSEFFASILASGDAAVAPALDGTGTVTATGISGSGDATVTPQLAGAGILAYQGTGSVTAAPQLAGTGSVTAAGISGSGGVALSPALAGAGTETMTGSGTVTPVPALAGSGSVAGAGVTGTGAVAVTPALAGTGTQRITGTGGVTVTPSLVGTGPGTTTTGTGAVTVAAPTLAGAGTLTLTGTGDVRTAPVLAGSGQVTVLGTGAATVTPVLGGNGLVVTPITGSGGVVVAFAVAGTGTRTSAAASAGGKYRPEWSGANADLAAATGFATEWAGARGDLGDAGL
ncbi:MAG: hypothetical protein IPK12_23475 [Gemmatimonadetes bacterium]|nr:hypothetical protein [Gemmatimonadota bacterium]